MTEKIRAAFERQAKALELRPTLGQGTAVTTARIKSGFTCEVEDGPWKLTVDMPEKHGGADAGPNPGVFGRGALASCCAIGYVRWAANLGVPLDDVQVAVHADYDVRGEMAVAEEVPAGYLNLRIEVRIVSPASEEDVRRVLDAADAHASFVDNYQRAIPVERSLELVAPGS